MCRLVACHVMWILNKSYFVHNRKAQRKLSYRLKVAAENLLFALRQHEAYLNDIIRPQHFEGLLERFQRGDY